MRNTPGFGSYANIWGTAVLGYLDGELADIDEQFHPLTDEALCKRQSKRSFSTSGFIKCWPDVFEGRKFRTQVLETTTKNIRLVVGIDNNLICRVNVTSYRIYTLDNTCNGP